jgi:hypothetical protein
MSIAESSYEILPGTSWNSVMHFTGPIDPATGEPIFDLAKVAFDRLSCH